MFFSLLTLQFKVLLISLFSRIYICIIFRSRHISKYFMHLKKKKKNWPSGEHSQLSRRVKHSQWSYLPTTLILSYFFFFNVLFLLKYKPCLQMICYQGYWLYTLTWYFLFYSRINKCINPEIFCLHCLSTLPMKSKTQSFNSTAVYKIMQCM